MKKNRHLILAVGYNGQKYSGSQYQANSKTIEGELGNVLQDLNGMRENEGAPSFSKASRTDAGVSAVLALFGYFGIEIEDLVQKINDKLPHDIRVFGIQRQTPRFNPRQMCTGRQYAYYLPISLLFCKQENILNVLTKRRQDYRNFLESRAEEINNHVAKPDQFIMATLDLEPENKPKYYKLSPGDQVDIFNKVYLEKLNQIASTSYVNRTGNYTFLSSMKDKTYSAANRKHIEFHFSEAKVIKERAYTKIAISGQAFLYNQIRKMIGALCVIARGQAPCSWLGRALSGRHEFSTDIPMVPGEYLLLCKQIYKSYQGSEEQKLYGELIIDSDFVQKQAELFKNDQILPHIFATSERVNDEFIRYVDEQVEKVDMYELAQKAVTREIEIGKIVQANKTFVKITK